MTPEEIVEELDAELRRRNEYYGLDNWDLMEVVQFVLERVPMPEGQA